MFLWVGLGADSDWLLDAFGARTAAETKMEVEAGENGEMLAVAEGPGRHRRGSESETQSDAGSCSTSSFTSLLSSSSRSLSALSSTSPFTSATRFPHIIVALVCLRLTVVRKEDGMRKAVRDLVEDQALSLRRAQRGSAARLNESNISCT